MKLPQASPPMWLLDFELFQEAVQTLFFSNRVIWVAA